MRALALSAAFLACQASQGPPIAAEPAVLAARPAAAKGAQAPTPRPAPPAVRVAEQPKPPEVPSAALKLDAAIRRLGGAFDGSVGLAVRDLQTGWTSEHRGLDYFPQQSVSKLWVAVTALEQVDAGRLDLSRTVTVTEKDLTLFHQPIRALALRPGGYRTTIEDLLTRALTQSDNTANDRLLREVGGPDAVRGLLTTKVLAGIRFGPGEERLQASIAGLAWPAEWAGGGGFYTAREALPPDRRQAAFEAYVEDPIDGATPLGVADALARLQSGKLLSPQSTQRLLKIMGQTRTGAMRLKAGLEPGWTLSHKTGTGQVLGEEQGGYNDVGILVSPEGRSYAVAVLIGRTSRPLPARMALMQKVVAATIAYDRDLTRQRASAAEPADEAPAPDQGTIVVNRNTPKITR